MTPSRISVNVHGNTVPDRQRLLDHLQILQPVAVLVLDSLDLARQIKTRLPNTTVIFREYGSKGDGDLHLQSDPQNWLDRHAHQADAGIVLHVLNEPPFDQDVIDWLTELLRLAAPRGIPLIIGNWAVGNPAPEKWAMARDMLRLLDQHRNLFILGLHEYAGGVVTSGLYGGYPDNAGVAPGKPGGMNLIQPSNWPQSVEGVTRYHMGRFKFLTDYCDSIHLRYPRIILTEHGFDDTSDIKAWEEKLKKNAPYLNVRGWKTLRDQWMEWWGHLGWSPERAYFEQLVWADQVIYQHSPVEAQCIFCWGHSSQDWEQFDIAEARELQRLLETKTMATTPAPTPIPEELGAAVPADMGGTDAIFNLREGTSTKHRLIISVRTGARVNVYPATWVESGGFDWYVVDHGKWRGWMAHSLENDSDILVPFSDQFKPLPLPPSTEARNAILSNMQNHLSLAAQHLEAVVTNIEQLKSLE